MPAKYKPSSPYKLLSAYWWNPFFWIVLILLPFVYAIVGAIALFIEMTQEIIQDLKEWDLK